MRLIGGAWRGRVLQAPPGQHTRPTADRVRQTLFDILLHAPLNAPWSGESTLHGQSVLDAFAGTGALGLEALSRGAAQSWFMEHDRLALSFLRRNIAHCEAAVCCMVLSCSVIQPPPGAPCGLVFLDPPYGQALLPPSLTALRHAGWIGSDTLITAELGLQDDAPSGYAWLVDRRIGAARILIGRV